MSDATEEPTPAISGPPVEWLRIGALALLAVALLQAAWRSSDLDDLVVAEIPAVAAWLFLAVLASAVLPTVAGRTTSAPDRRADHVVLVGLPIAVAVFHTVARSTDVDALRLVAALVTAAALLGFVVTVLPHRVRSGPTDVVQLGSLVAMVALIGNLALEVVDSLADESARPAALEARGPALGALAVLTGMTLAESGLRMPARAVADDRAGTFQMLLFGVGWLALIVGVALDDLGILVTAVGLQLFAIVVFLVRLAPGMLTAVAARASARWFALGLLAAAAYLGLLTQIAAGFADGRYADATSFPRWIEIAVDLSAFVGLAAGCTLGLAAQARDRIAGNRDRRVDTATLAIFLGGMTAVVVASVVDAPLGMRLGWLAIAVATLAGAWTAVAAGHAERPSALVDGPALR